MGEISIMEVRETELFWAKFTVFQSPNLSPITLFTQIKPNSASLWAVLRIIFFLYSGELNTIHLNTETFEMVVLRGYVLCTRPTIQIPDQCIRKQDGIHLSCIQTGGLSCIQIELKN